MEYVLIRYHHSPEHVLTLTSTRDASEAVAFVRHWSRVSPEDGVMVLLGQEQVGHCTPRAA